MQKAAAERVASLNINLNKFDKNKNGPGRLVYRHRNQWKISWENISFDEIEKTKDLIDQCLCSLIEGPITNYTLNIAKDEIASGHVGRAKELEAEEEKIEKDILNHFDQLDQIENEKNKKIIPDQIWNELLKLTTQSLEAVI